MHAPARSTKLVILDTSIVRDVVECRKNLDARSLFSALAGDTEGARYRFFIFEDELQSRHVEKLKEQFRSLIELFARDLKVVSYSAMKNSYHEKCGELLRAVKRAFGLREDENCRLEVESDAFLLIAACAMMKGYSRVTIVTSDTCACEILRAAVNDLQFSGRVEVLCL